MRLIKHNFNLIEIMLALGVVLIGICSIMVLFPIGANASRDASVETEISHSVEQFLNYMRYKFQENNGEYWSGQLGSPNYAKKIYRATGNNSEVYDYIPEKSNTADTNSGTDFDTSNKWYQIEIAGEEQLFFASTKRPGEYQIISTKFIQEDSKPTIKDILKNIKTDDRDNIANEEINYKGKNPNGIIDNRVILRVMHEKVDGFDKTIAVRLIIEASWPAQLTPDKRQKEKYTLELYNEKRLGNEN